MTKSAVSKMAAAAAVLLVLMAVPAAVAEDYDVGDDSGWTSGFDYTAWARGKTFRVGDVLEFKYGPTHTVDEVTKDGYDNCDRSKFIQKYSGGDNKITLNKTGPIYFICPTSGHCEGGMKLTVNVLAASGPTPGTPTTPGSPSPPSSTPGSPSPPSSTPGSPSTPSSPGTPPAAGSTPERPPPPPNAATRGMMSYGMMGVTMVLGYGVWIMG